MTDDTGLMRATDEWIWLEARKAEAEATDQAWMLDPKAIERAKAERVGE